MVSPAGFTAASTLSTAEAEPVHTATASPDGVTARSGLYPIAVLGAERFCAGSQPLPAGLTAACVYAEPLHGPKNQSATASPAASNSTLALRTFCPPSETGVGPSHVPE